MEFDSIYSALVSTEPLIPTEKLDSISKLYENHNLDKMARVLVKYYDGTIPEYPPPKYTGELTPTVSSCLSEFQKELASKSPYYLTQMLSKAIIDTGLDKILVILGQRITEGSIQTKNSFPPEPSLLINSANQIHKEGLSVAARARSKHVGRDNFWGEITGKTENKNIIAKKYVEKIIDNHTWWNIYSHFKHNTIFEMRLPSGHGARWSGDGSTFIGFVEPFDSEYENIF